MKKNAPEELDYNILDNVSESAGEFIVSEEVIVIWITYKKTFTIAVSELWRSDECPTCRGPLKS